MSQGRDVFIVANTIEEMGGLVRFAHTLANLLDQRGHRVHLIGIVHAARPHDYGEGPFSRTVLHEDDPPSYWRPAHLLHRLRPGRQFNRLRRHLIQRRGAKRLSELFSTAAPGSVIVVCQVWAMEWVRLANTHGMPVIGMSHESYEASRGSGRYARIRRFYRQADRLLVLTQRDADRWAIDGMSNVGAMPNPLSMRATEIGELTAPNVIALGRLSFEKGFDMLLQSWAGVVRVNPGWHLRIYGDGPLREDLQQQINTMGLQGSAHLMGPISDVSVALLDSSIYALSSRSEGMPVVLCEAMELGVPCVAFDVAPGVREIITHEENGLVVTPGNTDQLASAINQLIADVGMRQEFGRKAHESVQRFAPEAVTDRWEREFDLLYR